MKKIFYLLIIICGFLFIQNVSAGDYYYYDTKQWVMDGTWSDHALTFDNGTNTYKSQQYVRISSIRNGFKPTTRIDYDFDADYVYFNLFFEAPIYISSDPVSLNTTCKNDLIILDEDGYYEGEGPFNHFGSLFGGCSSILESMQFDEKILSASVFIKQDGPMLPCQFIGNIGSGILTVSCPLQRDVHYITAVIFNITSSSGFAIGDTTVGIGRYFALEKSDNSSNTISSAIINQTDTMNKNQQQTNNRLDNLNNSITSNSSDTSSESCGLLCKLKGIFTGIIELPSKLVNLLIEALKALFVPTDNQLYEIINDSKDLSENFGFVGESINFFITIFTSLLGLVNANGCIEFPEFTVGATSMFDSVTFWENQLICLNDNVILSTHIETIRTVTSIVLVCLFINFAAAKFFSILSKNDSVQTSKDSYEIRRDNP